MSHIVSFRIEGLVGREDAIEINLNRDINIFFGLNGSGKTSLLKILHSAMSNDTSILKGVPFSYAEVKIFSINYNEVITKFIKKISETNNKKTNVRKVKRQEVLNSGEYKIVDEVKNDIELEWQYAPTSKSLMRRTRWSHGYLPTTRLHTDDQNILPILRQKGSENSWITEEQLDTFFSRSIEFLWNQYSSEILSTVRMAQEEGLASILRAVLSPESNIAKQNIEKLTAETAYKRVQDFLKRQMTPSILGTKAEFEKRYNADSLLQNVVQDINHVEARIDEAMLSRNKLKTLITKMFSGNKEILFNDGSIEVKLSNGSNLELGSLSSGEKHLLKIFVQTLLVGPSSLMIDEPELSMHIDWQRILVDSLTALNNQAQFIFATHSPEIMGNISDEKIFKL